jgi:hypothetical protein
MTSQLNGQLCVNVGINVTKNIEIAGKIRNNFF